MTAESTAPWLHAIPDDGPYIAAVAAADGIRFATTAATRGELVSRLAEYVRDHARVQLWPADALRVRALLHLGDAEGAVAHYFARVGERWDEEWLITGVVESGRSEATRLADAECA